MEIKNNIYLKEYTSYKTGGKALYFADCKSSKDVASALNFASDNKLNYEVIGGGSNLLISDDGYNGLIICTKSLNQYIINKGSGIIKCGAGIVLADLVLYACNHGLSGMEAMAGIPGSTGGACKMNAGAFNQEIKDTLLNVTYMNDDGSIKTIKNEEVGFAYRKSPALNGKIVLYAEFAYGKDKVETLLNKRREIRRNLNSVRYHQRRRKWIKRRKPTTATSPAAPQAISTIRWYRLQSCCPAF